MLITDIKIIKRTNNSLDIIYLLRYIIINMSRKIYTLEDHLKESLKDSAFRLAWEASEVEYQLSRQVIAQRLKRKMTQKQLAVKAKTTQAVISRLERMTTNVSVELLKRIADAFDTQLKVRFE